MDKDYHPSSSTLRRPSGDMIRMDHKEAEDDYDGSSHHRRQRAKSLHDDSDLSNDVHGEVGKGLQRNLQARHLTMISLGKVLRMILCNPSHGYCF